ncbi:glycosyltransferase [Candidatus Poribacteria bacterium]|nr:glycosyltransferase [Candidatus Poribacteria bacterium]
MSHPTISLCMIVKNEEKLMENCLKSVAGLVDEIIIVDTGSTDRTVELCKKYTDKIFFAKWENDFSKPRNLSIEKAACDWIFLLDADEVVSPIDHDKIKKLVQDKKAIAYYVATRNYSNFCAMVGWQPNDKKYSESMQYKGWVISTKVRLFKNHMGLFFKGEVHEMIDYELKRRNLPILQTDVPIHHYGKSLEKDRTEEKQKKYLEISIEKIKKHPDDYKVNFELGIQYREIKDMEMAEKYLRKALELKPNFILAYSELGIVLGLTGRMKESIEIFSRGIAINPNCADLYNNLGFAYEAVNNILKAEECYSKALKITPESEAIKKNMNNVLQKKNNRHESISLCMIVKNEEKNLEEFFGSVSPYFEEIIVVDTGSTDNTRAVAIKYGAKIYDFPWINDFAAARNESIKHAASDWIMWCDADDRISEQDLKKIRKAIKQQRDTAFYCILSNVRQKEIDSTCNQLRIFPNLPEVKFERPIHEQVIYSLKKYNLKFSFTDIVINHMGYEDEIEVEKKIQRNIAIIEIEMKKNPDDHYLKFQMASSFAALKHFSKAEELLNEIVSAKSKDVGREMYAYSLVFLGKITKQSDFEKAKRYFNDAADFAPDYGVAHFCLGEIFYEKEEWENAINALEQAKHYGIKAGILPLKKERFEFSTYYYLGKAYQKTGNIKKMEENYDLAVKFGENRLENQFDIGLSFIQEKIYSKASEIFKSLKEKKFRKKDSMFFYSLTKLYQRNFAEAKAQLEQIVVEFPEMTEAYLNLGVIEENSGEIEKAIYYYKKVIELDPVNFECIANLAHLYLKICEFNIANKYFKEAANLNPDVMDIQLGLAVHIAYEINTKEQFMELVCELEKIWAKIVSIDKSRSYDHLNKITETDKKFEWLGDTFWQNHKLREALICYQIVSFLHNNEKYYKEKLINYYIVRGKISSAIQVIEGMSGL